MVGVGGAGMSALAKILLGRGHSVTGSDLRGGEVLRLLADIGIEVWEGHRPNRMAGVDLVVASSAVPEADPELRAARGSGVEVWRRPRLLEVLTASIPTIGPTGTHGKTTTTAMMVWALRAAGVDPSFVVGGEMVGFATNAHLGEDDLLVLEVDEAFGTFEHVSLQGLVVTNVESDHLDHFHTVERMEESFVRVAGSVAGPVLACSDDPGAARVAERVATLTYGTNPSATWRIEDFWADSGRSRFTLRGPGGTVGVTVPRLGMHIVRNAAGALALLSTLGYDLDLTAPGLESFAGVRRRFESKGVVAGVRIVDDYAHHPTEVAATLREAAQLGARRVWAVFQPHLYSRTRDLYDEFGLALSAADGIVVTDVYGSREAPLPGITGRLVEEAARRAGAASVHYVPHRSDVADRLVELIEPGDLVVTMGAGDITLVASELAAALSGRKVVG